MKNLKVVLLAALAAVGLAGCNKTCNHVDENKDHKCDLCQEIITTCVDESPKDHFCDICGLPLEGDGSCTDANKDHVCDYCGKNVGEHADGDNDHKCDYCQAVLSQCADNDNDHNCDVCGTKLTECVDANKDHKCDICETELSQHSDLNHDGTCDYCGETDLEYHHVDADKDGKCDVCDTPIIVEKTELIEGKKLYALGEDFDEDGFKIVATMTDETEKELDYTVSGYDKNQLGDQNVTLTFDKNGQEDTLTVKVNVSYWSEADLSVLEKATLLGKYADPLPFMPGLKAEADEQEGTWNLVKENATLDDVDEYWELLTDYEDVVTIQGSEVTFAFSEYPTTYLTEEDLAFIEDEYGFANGDFYVFTLIPFDVGNYGPQRFFVADEYFIFGLNGEGDFKLYDRFIEAYWDGYFSGNENCELEMYDVALIKSYDYSVKNDFLAELAAIPYYYFSELAPEFTAFPDMSANEGLLIFNSLKTYFPFDTSFDKYIEAVTVDLVNGTEAERTAFVAELLDLGYEQDAENQNIYTYSSEYVGTITYYVSAYSDKFVTNTYGAQYAAAWKLDGGYRFGFYYEAPERDDFITALTPELDYILNALGENVNFLEINTDYYDRYGKIIADFWVLADEDPLDSEAVEAQLAALVKVAGFYTLEEAEYDEDYECWCETFVNGEYGFELDVYDADEDGDCEVQIYLYEDETDTIETFVNKVAYLASWFKEEEITPTEAEGVYTLASSFDAEETGAPSADAFLDYIVGEYVKCGILKDNAPEAAETEPESGIWFVAASSYNGAWDVVFTVTSGEGKYNVVIAIKETETPDWVGTAEEGMDAFAEAIGLPEALISEVNGTFITEQFTVTGQNAYLLENEENIVTAVESFVASKFPNGCAVVEELAKDAQTNLWNVVYTSADGEITFEIEIEFAEVVENLYVPFITVSVYNTPISTKEFGDGFANDYDLMGVQALPKPNGDYQVMGIFDTVENAANYGVGSLTVLSSYLQYFAPENASLLDLYTYNDGQGGKLLFFISEDETAIAQVSFYVANVGSEEQPLLAYIVSIYVYRFEMSSLVLDMKTVLDNLGAPTTKLGVTLFQSQIDGSFYTNELLLASVDLASADDSNLLDTLAGLAAIIPQGYSLVGTPAVDTDGNAVAIYENANGDTIELTLSYADSQTEGKKDVVLVINAFEAEEE